MRRFLADGPTGISAELARAEDSVPRVFRVGPGLRCPRAWSRTTARIITRRTVSLHPSSLPETDLSAVSGYDSIMAWRSRGAFAPGGKLAGCASRDPAPRAGRSLQLAAKRRASSAARPIYRSGLSSSRAWRASSGISSVRMKSARLSAVISWPRVRAFNFS